METEKKLTCQNQNTVNQHEFEAAINELNDYLTQIWSIKNILQLLYDVLRAEKQYIADVSSVIVPCIWQLDYIYKHSNQQLDAIMDYSITR